MSDRPSEIVALLRAVPSLIPAVERLEASWSDDPDGPGLYIYVDAIWDGLLHSALEADHVPDAAFLGWLETLASSDDEAQQTFLKVGLLEVMGDHREWFRKVRRAMGPETRARSDEIETFWGRPIAE